MATVVRFVFKDTTEIFIPGVGLVKNGIFDVPAMDTATVATVRTRLVPYDVSEEMADDSIALEPPVRYDDPYPQYLTLEELGGAGGSIGGQALISDADYPGLYLMNSGPLTVVSDEGDTDLYTFGA